MNVLQRSITLLCVAASFGAHAQLTGAPLVETLKRGAITVYFRHAATNHSQADRKDAPYEDCAQQRNLDDTGRAQARAIGDAMRALGLALGDVLASPYCRTMETARLIAGRATASRDVLGSMHAGRLDYSDLERLLASPPPAGQVRVIVSHGNPMLALAGDPELAEGEAAVIRGDGERWKIVARIRAQEWPALVAKPK